MVDHETSDLTLVSVEEHIEMPQRIVYRSWSILVLEAFRRLTLEISHSIVGTSNDDWDQPK